LTILNFCQISDIFKFVQVSINQYFSHEEETMKIFFRKQTKMILVLIAIVLLAMSSCVPTSVTQPDPTQKAEPTEPVLLSAGVQEIGGVVISGGDTTPEGLLDAPRTFIYQVLLDTGEEINVTFTANPPSPIDQTQPVPKLTFYAGTINVGDYLVARGTYDLASRTLAVALEADFIETFAKKP
jgi:hypothetical protein